MLNETLARMRRHHNNIARFCKLLKISLNDLERQFLETRFAEEQSALEKIAASTLHLAFRVSASPRPLGGHNAGGKVGRPWSERLGLGGSRRRRQADGAWSPA
jgi:hypothetical protein